MALMLAQGAWAKAASYCQHESTQTRHFGHHIHAHHQGEAPASSYAGDNDCGVCHLGMACSVPCAQTALAIIDHAAPIPDARSGNAPPHAEPPDRPNWSRLA